MCPNKNTAARVWELLIVGTDVYACSCTPVGWGGGGGGTVLTLQETLHWKLTLGEKSHAASEVPDPHQDCARLFSQTLYPLSYPHPLTGSGKKTIMCIYHALINTLSAQRCLCRMKGRCYRVNAKIIYNILLKQVCSCVIFGWCEYAFLWLDKTGSKMALDKTGSKMAVQL